MWWMLGSAANSVIAVAYLAIAWAIVRPLIQTNQLRTNRLGAATAAIFFTCAVHHGFHTVHMVLPAFGVDQASGYALRAAFDWHMVAWDFFGAGVAIYYWSLRRIYGALMNGAKLFEDLQEREDRANELSIKVDERTAELQSSLASLEAAQADLARARDEAMSASRMKSEFLANMSHEIRTPLNGVIGMNGLLLDTVLDADQRDFAETARRSGEALLVVINDILDFSKIEAGKLSLEQHAFGPRTVVEDVLQLFAADASQNGIELVGHLDDDVAPTAFGDSGRLRQVLTNLVGNAVKFTRQGEVVVRVSSSEDRDGALLRFVVSDTGVGLAPDRSDRLFDPFVQGDASTSRRYGGTGLGLAISKRLVEMMGGTIGVDSVLGRGSSFWFTVRVGRFGRVGSAAHPEFDTTAFRDLCVLIADDNATTCEVLGRQLASWGMSTRSATDCANALEILRACADNDTLPDIALIDAMLPGSDGLDGVVRAIAADPTLATVRLVVLSSALSPYSAVDPRVSAKLSKPVRQQQLFNCLFALVNGDSRATVDDAAPSPMATEASPTGPSRTEPTVGPRLLVAEDNPINARVVSTILRHLGYRVDVVGNGKEAVEAWSRVPYAAVLMDCQMPEMDGYEATKEIRRRQDPATPATIIALTASAMQGDMEKCLAAGMDAYLSKPIRGDALDALLHDYIASEALSTAGGS